jgi:hypothetical protein
MIQVHPSDPFQNFRLATVLLRGRRNQVDAELYGCPARGLFPFRGDARDRLASVLDDRDGRRLRRTAVERRLRSVGYVKLNGLATFSPRSSAASRSAPSIPAVTPAANTQFSSTTTRSFTGVAPK